ncbi:MAG: glycosyltransferase family 1 protein [Actinomycetota bacterium]
MRAVVQTSASRLLPDRIEAITRPPSRGARRVAQGLRPINDADLIHGLDVDLPLWSSSPTVSTVHDLSVFDVPLAFSRYRAAGERLVVRRSIARADALIAVSAFTAERIEHHFGRTATVIPLAAPAIVDPFRPADVDRVRARHALPDRFVLQLATIEPRKDVAMLAEACAANDVPLVLAGADPDGRAPTGAKHLGYVATDDLQPLLAAADVVAYISHYEGFGLPPLEAMARGRPVVASAVGGLPDVAADGAELVRPGDVDQLAKVIGELWHDDDRRRELGERGRIAAGRLSWSATAAATLDVYRTLGLSV